MSQFFWSKNRQAKVSRCFRLATKLHFGFGWRSVAQLLVVVPKHNKKQAKIIATVRTNKDKIDKASGKPQLSKKSYHHMGQIKLTHQNRCDVIKSVCELFTKDESIAQFTELCLDFSKKIGHSRPIFIHFFTIFFFLGK